MKKSRSQFTYNATPMLRYTRSMFDLSHKHLTTMNEGDLVPVFLEEVCPGDTFKITANALIRTSSPLLRPIMDNMFIDTMFFYVPSRILYKYFVNVFGENTKSAWADSVEYLVPSVNGVVTSGTVADHFGVPLNKTSSKNISVLPFRAFARVYDDWFRDQNNVQPMHIQEEGSVGSENLNNNEWSPSNYTGRLPKVAKFHDMFTSCLPAPQKGKSVDLLPQGLPVIATGVEVPSPGRVPMYITPIDGSNFGNVNSSNYFSRFAVSSTVPDRAMMSAYYVTSPEAGSDTKQVTPSNLWAQGTLNVNDLRMGIQLQKLLERDARGGTRYTEYLLSHWGVSSPDGRLQRSEFLGGKRTPLNVNQVTQVTGGSSGDDNKLGDLAATSLSFARARATKGFVEHGYVIGVACIRQFHTYQQGIRKLWSRKSRTDFYDPVFANIGEQPIYARELYGAVDDDDQVFGYNEAWVQYRRSPNEVTGQMRSGLSNSLDLWHLADNYDNAPTLSKGFIEETTTYLDRCLTVSSRVQDQFICDFYFENIAYRNMPTYSVPSLIDHN